ncbi:uncharacterized protein Pyn_28373 [Prunus yedoensis var. nudiflora]|uniref:F-box/kelch-repeat protein n=1 Tax=Prunus yedoensis var. nudiflora TaxID=2094558 RepID=A0A314Y3W5_PRUYE|nr:uncharacterized protein Pyn_28373 [Prunus yedoensis var. nudiflora]
MTRTVFPFPAIWVAASLARQILFAGGVVSPSECQSGTELCGFEMPSTSNSTVESSSSQLNNTIIKPKRFVSNFLGGKPHPLLVELRGRLYALAGNPTAYRSDVCFEVFDNKRCETWAPLTNPPLFHENSPFFLMAGPHNFSYAIAGTKIMVCTQDTPVFCFDVADPKQEWEILHSMCAGGPFPFVGRALVVDLQRHRRRRNRPGGTKDKLLFAYQETAEDDWRIVAYHMYNNESRIRRIQVLPPLARAPNRRWERNSSYSFAHLGGTKVCFVLASYSRDYEYPFNGSGEKMHLMVQTFEYSISKAYEPATDSDDARSLSVKVLSTRIFEYDWRDEPHRTLCAELLGCFVL